jgi:hypothetical protein
MYHADKGAGSIGAVVGAVILLVLREIPLARRPEGQADRGYLSRDRTALRTVGTLAIIFWCRALRFVIASYTTAVPFFGLSPPPLAPVAFFRPD